jgi:hypothetical protein
MSGLVFKEYAKRGTVTASHLPDGSVELSFAELKWITSPRTLDLCYENHESKDNVYKPKARRVRASFLTQDTAYESVGGKKRVALKGSVLLSWGNDLSECWSLDEDVFNMRYEKCVGEEQEQEKKEVKEETSVAAASSESGNVSTSFLSASVQGKRDENEDAHVSVPNWKPNLSLFGVFDGHGGADASAYCAKKMPAMLEWNEENPEAGFVSSFVALDRKYIGKNNDDGCTVLVAVVDSKQRKVTFEKNVFFFFFFFFVGKVFVGNAGDSRAILVRGGEVAAELSSDHKVKKKQQEANDGKK